MSDKQVSRIYRIVLRQRPVFRNYRLKKHYNELQIAMVNVWLFGKNQTTMHSPLQIVVHLSILGAEN